ncbi:DsrE family protein [Cyclobacterium sp. 1_MG-2023]|uniref:DsrE family protein n=1 Tax=Cyclobacterium sp. 1_MG-2023 TaxID=3062681 RepID=UPI0026E3D1B4|nr:DsrE family protein [Cyclobacterium sp. 1_MG-2023]MDO6435983.1 DsrE family protein [Cyclobacterium sp. 1_MG-2023]
MKQFIHLSFFVLLISSSFLVKAQVVDQKVHQVIFQVTKGEMKDQNKAIGQLNNILKALPKAEIEVICHGNALPMLLKTESQVKEGIADLQQRGVIFAACENTMKRAKVSKDDLIPGSITVPSGLAEIIIRQEQGWAYIKAGN